MQTWPGIAYMMCFSLQKHYAKDSPERKGLAAAVAALKKEAPLDIPLVIGGKQVLPHL